MYPRLAEGYDAPTKFDAGGKGEAFSQTEIVMQLAAKGTSCYAGAWQLTPGDPRDNSAARAGDISFLEKKTYLPVGKLGGEDSRGVRPRAPCSGDT